MTPKTIPIAIVLVLAVMVACALAIADRDDGGLPTSEDRQVTYERCLEADELPDEDCSTPAEQVETVDRFAEFTRCVRADDVPDEVCTEQLHDR